jgi:hypothetical protein
MAIPGKTLGDCHNSILVVQTERGNSFMMRHDAYGLARYYLNPCTVDNQMTLNFGRSQNGLISGTCMNPVCSGNLMTFPDTDWHLYSRRVVYLNDEGFNSQIRARTDRDFEWPGLRDLT